MRIKSFAVLAVVLSATMVARAADGDEYKALAPFTTAETVIVCKLAKVTAGPVSRSLPPIYTFRFQFETKELLRGIQPDPTKVCNYSIRQNDQPKFDTETLYLVGLNQNTVVTLLRANDADIARVKELIRLPAGWTIQDKKPLSPWTVAGEKAWPKVGPKTSDPLCAKTGRPALLCGNGIEWKVEQVPAKNPMKFKNDMYGDGKFKVTVTNTTRGPATVAALLTDGKGAILWADSVLLMHAGKAHTLAGGGKVTAESKALVLKGGESVSAELDTLPVQGIDWPRGGQRVYFDFLLGEKSTNNFFYYFSAVHDPLREEALKAVGSEK